MKRSLIAVAAALAVTASAFAAGAGSAPPGKRNPLAHTVVRFVKGTTPAQMQTIVTRAGGVVTTDLTSVGTLGVVPSDGNPTTLIAKLKASKQVRAAFEEKVIANTPPDAEIGETGNNNPTFGSGSSALPDPWHALPVGPFGTPVPGGKLQWDDYRMSVPAAWSRTTGAGVKVAVLDSGVQGSHKELLANYDNRNSANTIPCNTLTRTYGPGVMSILGDCSSEDTSGHGTWVASRIAGAANGFGSNGVAPNATVAGYKVLATGFGGFTSWIVAGMVDACNDGADVINMSLGGYNDPTVAADAEDYLLWVDAVDYCRAEGTAIFASAGNDHVRVNRVNMTVGGRALVGVGQADTGDEGISSVIPGTASLEKYVNDLRGMLLVPAGVPGVIMVSATNNKVPEEAAPNSPAGPNYGWQAGVRGATDQLTYYSSYGSRVDIAAPGGARKFNIPRYDIGNADVLYDGWGTLGATDASSEICRALGSIFTFACFKVNGAAFAFLQGTSMSAPNATGVGVLTLAAHPGLKGNPDALLQRLKSTARTDMTNHMGPNDPDDKTGGCTTGWCHVDRNNPIAFSDAYGAGIVDAAAAVG